MVKDIPLGRKPSAIAGFIGNTWNGIAPIYRNGIKIGAIALPVVVAANILGSFGNEPTVGATAELTPSAAPLDGDDEIARHNADLWREVRTAHSTVADETQDALERLQQARGQRWNAWAVSRCLSDGCEPSERLLEERRAVDEDINALTRYGSLSSNTDTAEQFRALVAKRADLDAALAMSRDERNRTPQTAISVIDLLSASEAFEDAIGTYLNPVNQVSPATGTDEGEGEDTDDE